MGTLRSLHDTARGVGAVVALVVLLSGTAPLAALDPEPEPERATAEMVSEATRRALELANATGDHEAAAAFLVETVNGYAPDDPAGYGLLVLAARLYDHDGGDRDAYWTLRRAAQLAYATGLRLEAAHTLLDAATLAEERGNGNGAREAAELAGFVLRTSELTEGQRASVLGRVEYARG